MQGNSPRLSRLIHARAVRGVTAVLLALTVASTGAVVVASSAYAAAPALSVTPPTSPDNDLTPSWQFDELPATSYECSLELATSTPSFAPCTSPFVGSLTGGGAADGTYRFAVREVGDVTESTDDYVLDTVARVAVLVTSPTSSLRPTFDLQPEPDVTSQTCSLDGATPPVDCTSMTSFTPSADLTPGTHTLDVAVVDQLSNTGSQSKSVLIDTTPPVAPTITGSSGTGTDPALSWSWPLGSDETSACSLTTPKGTSTVSCPGGSYSGTANGNGDYHLTVTLTDGVGNAGAPTDSPVYTFDAPLPATPAFTSSPPASGKDPRPQWAFTQPTSDLTCQLNGPATIAPASCDGGSYAPLVDLTDGTWTLTVTARDGVGNSSSQTSGSYLLDTQGPAAPTVSLSTDPALPYRFSWSSSLSSPPAFCRLVVLSDVPPTTGSESSCDSGQYDAAITASGSYQVEVYVVGPTGVAGAVGKSPVLDVDLTAPATPVLSGLPPTSNDKTPKFDVTVEPGATALCWFSDGTTESAHTDCHLGTYQPTLTNDGPYAIFAQQKDAAGNLSGIGQVNYLLDATFPDNPVVTGPTAPTSDPHPTFTIATTEPGLSAVCTLTLNGAPAQSEPCGTPYQPTLSGEGTWVLNVTVTDDAGNASSGASAGFLLDTVPPADPSVQAPPSPGSSTAPVWTFSDEPSTTATCELTFQDGSVVSPLQACTSPYTTTLASPQDGTYTLAVQRTDEVGLKSAVVTADYLLDTHGPTTTFTNQPASPGRTRSLSFSFSTETGATVACTLSSGATVLATYSTCTSPQTVTIDPALPEGTYTFGAQATDAAQNVGPEATATYVLDLTPPDAPVLVSAPATVSPSPTPTWTFTAEAGATIACSLTSSTGTVVAGGACSNGTFTPAPPLSAEGTYAFRAVATDAAGNVGTAALTGTYELDTTAPVTPTVIAPPTPGGSASLQWTVSTTEGTVQCHLAKGTVVLVDWTACGPVFSATLSGGDGSYTFSARGIDAAGNTSAEVISTYRLDTTPPASAVVTAPRSPSSNRSPVWTIAATEFSPLADCQVLGPTGSVFRDFAPCPISTSGTPYALDLTDAATAPDGSYTLVVRLTDHAGNVNVTDATGVYTLDTTAPNAVLVTAPVTPSSSRTPTWLLTGDADADLQCRLSSPGVAGTYAPCAKDPGVPGSGSFAADLTSSPDDTYTLSVRSVDAAGNVGPDKQTAYTLDTLAPATPRTPVTGPSPSRQPVVVWTFSLEAGATGRCSLSSTRGALLTDAPCSSPFTTDLDALNGGRDSDYALSLLAVDQAGNTSGSVTAHYVLDRTAPNAPVVTASPGSPNPSQSPSWGIQGNDTRDRLECRLTGLPTSTWAACSDPVSYDLAPAKKGTFVLEVRETDEAGNVSSTTTSPDYVLDLTAPAPPAVLPPKPQRSNSTHPVFTITADKETVALACKVTRFDGLPAKATPCAVGPNTVDLTGIGRADGPVVLSVQGSDAVGNSSGSASATYSFDSIPPTTPSVVGPNPGTGFDRQVEFNFGDSPDAASYVCSLRKTGQSGPVTTVPCATPYRVTLPSTGSFTLTVWAVDKAGNSSLRSASAAYTLLQSVPVLAAPRGPTSGSDPTPTWTFQIPSGYRADCVLGMPGGQALSYDCSSPVFALRVSSSGFRNLQAALNRTSDVGQAVLRTTSFTADLTGRPAGAYSLSARLTDALGHDGDYSPKAVYNYQPRGFGGGQAPPPSAPQAGPTVPSGPNKAPGAVTPPRAAPAATNLAKTERQVDRAPKSAPKPQGLPATRVPAALPHLNEVPKVIGNTIADSLQKPTIPLLLVVIVVGFLLLQNQIDRRDPKLASAPVGAEPELEFGPARGKGRQVRIVGGGASA
ncbi:MAG: Cable pili-associated 22 kDa adhesin protein [Frankiales bacterium]|nr:Cable pili-associated 22 kDa adhesin protein [Frankiales bacterium]